MNTCSGQMLILFIVRFLVHTIRKHKKWCIFHEQESFQEKSLKKGLSLYRMGVSRRPRVVLSFLQMSFAKGYEKSCKDDGRIVFKLNIHFRVLRIHCKGTHFHN
jgi:hypothetical protein